jgi:eukaryotic-like serine/threonine-protein kinase
MTREDDLFAEALELNTADRATFLDQACAADGATRAGVEALLLAHAQAGDFLTTPRVPVRSPVPDEKPGDLMGHFQLVRPIGEGGCGTVWLAEQAEPLRRQVAIKVIKCGMDTKDVVARFEAERHALALMEHPGIARVFDAGATATGRPYFAMELVRGEKITDFCDDNLLNTADRLVLFVQVCRAIQHAHLKGVIHRDIKPSNILVSRHEGVAVPKVIDFGVAMATAGPLTDNALTTRVESLVGTPAYMSPEQLVPGGTDIDTRCDVYGLGVLLYELLTGRPPFDPRILTESGLEAMCRLIRSSDPFKPSTRLATLSRAERSAIARLRATETHQLVRSIRGDLDCIAMRCLEKSRNRRYDTANELARDVEHHLNHEPVHAHPPGQLYRAGKFAARHEVLTTSVITAFAVLVLVAAGASLLAWQARTTARAESERSSRSDLTLGSQNLEAGKVSEGLAFLVRAARTSQRDPAVGPRLLSALAHRGYFVPIGQVLPHGSPLRDAAYSADGQRVLTAAMDGLRIWSLADGGGLSPRGSEVFSRDKVIVGCASPDLRLIATGGASGVVEVIESDSGRRALPPLPHAGTITGVLFSPDGRWLASSSWDGVVNLWDVATGGRKAALEHGAPIPASRLVFSADGTRLLVCTRGTQWYVWKVPGGEPALPPQGSPALELEGFGDYSPDGRLLAITDTKGAQLHEADTGRRFGPHLDHEQPCSEAVFSRDGTRVATSSDDAVTKLWNVSALDHPLFVLRHDTAVHETFFTEGDRYLVTRTANGLVRAWSTESGQLASSHDQNFSVQRLTASWDGGEFLTSDRFDSSVRRWRPPARPIQPHRFSAERGRVDVRLAGDGNEAYLIHHDRMQRVSLPSGVISDPARPYPAELATKVPFLLPGGQTLLAPLASREYELWDLHGPEIIRRPLDGITRTESDRFLFHPASRRLAILHHNGSGYDVDVWNSRTGERLGVSLHPGNESIELQDFSPDGALLVTTATAERIELWDLATGQRREGGFPAPWPVYMVKFSPDGRRLAAAAGLFAVYLWDVETQEQSGPPLLQPWGVTRLQFSADGGRLLTSGMRETRIWDVATGSLLTTPMQQPYSPRGALVEAMFREGDSLVVTRTLRGEVRVYDSRTGQLLVEPLPVGQGAIVTGFDADGRHLAVATDAGVTLWPLPPLSVRAPVPDWLLRLATATAGGTLDRFATFCPQSVDAAAYDALRREVTRMPDDAPYVQWGRWLLADPESRPISPGARLTANALERAPTLPCPPRPPRRRGWAP